MKVILAQKDAARGTHLLLNLDQTLAMIKKMDSLTLGMPKIIYLVGWQYYGHDSKYPAFFEVNEALKRPQDASALDSLKWLIREAAQYHTIVSVHINLRDAYESSPLWKEYVDHDLLMRGEDGKLAQGGVWGGERAYLVCYTKEWESGYTQKRLNKLLELLPIQAAGTVHIDAFHTDECSGQKISREQETETQRKIFRYLRDRGVDVTSEFGPDYRIDPLVGLQPMAWWLHQTAADYLQRPASLYVGGVDDSLNGKLFGTSMHGEDIAGKDPEGLPGFLHDFCLQTAPWYYLNRHQRLKLEQTADDSTVFFTGGITTHVDRAGKVTISEQGRVIRDGDEILIPALWRNYTSAIAYSANGYEAHWWTLPLDWKGTTAVNAEEITLSGLHPSGSLQVTNGRVQLSLKPDHALLLTPAK